MILLLLVFILLYMEGSGAMVMGQDNELVTFQIKRFVVKVKGQGLIQAETIKQVLRKYLGKNKSATDVEKARSALEQVYHSKGYPAVLVNIPEQTVENGSIVLEVEENKIGKVWVKGNRFFRISTILKAMPSLKRGKVLYLPKVQEELSAINQNPDLTVIPQLIPGREPGTTDIILRVKDTLPLHGSLEFSNRHTPNTTPLRLNASIRYDNLWQANHSISFQFQTSPINTDEVKVVAASYLIPSLLLRDDIFVIYGVLSDSDTAFGQGFEVVGNGHIIGTRYIIPLPGKGEYSHNLSLGIDYKKFDEELAVGSEEEGLKTPITYVPISLLYNSVFPDQTGNTRFSAGLNLSIRGLGSSQKKFERKRFKGKANYLYAKFGIHRIQELPWHLGLHIDLDGQVVDSPLISNEQYLGGGMENVRGYLENEEAGDNAIHGTVELLGPDFKDFPLIGKHFTIQPYLFYDHTMLWIKDALPGEDSYIKLRGTGLGIKGKITRYLKYEANWACALDDTSHTNSGNSRFYFLITASF